MNYKKLFLLIFVCSLALRSFAADPVEEGRQIFNARCASCHNVNKKLVGPALAGVTDRRTVEWIENFIHGSQKMIQAGDKDALKLYNEFNQVAMPDHPDITKEQVAAILDFVKKETEVIVAKAPFARPGQLTPAYVPVEASNWEFFLGYGGVVLLLILVLLLAVQVKSTERENGGKFF
ncbi:hypothetical protein COR50_00915 [Chitinophaga caeni]|uniref:Cytochrome c domain-containing protein n=1 Tax=Chitinophaga caeni TaxID=2029983 RepID=A0A291QPR3_9BACT|nr:cytochrome c [Chitinophaga caeni]ATL45834.1 hypothetical protein COR50_00915 [Chitinophaga caeni]